MVCREGVAGTPKARSRKTRCAMKAEDHVSELQAAEIAGSVFKAEPPISRRTLAFFENDNAFDTSAARRAFGFDPRVELLEGVQRVAAADA